MKEEKFIRTPDYIYAQDEDGQGWRPIGDNHFPGPLTCMGYNVQELLMVANLLRTHGLTPQDLREMRRNLELALRIVRSEYERAYLQVPPQEIMPDFLTKTLHIKAEKEAKQ